VGQISSVASFVRVSAFNAAWIKNGIIAVIVPTAGQSLAGIFTSIASLF
jgi:hypothetical protein